MTVNKYIIIELDGSAIPGKADMTLDDTPRTFVSIEAAEKYLREDAKNTLAGDTELQAGRMEEWGYPVAICKIMKVVKPVPVVIVKVEIKEVQA